MTDELKLNVIASTIDGKGIVKVDPESFEKLKLSDGMKVTVTYGAKSRSMEARKDMIHDDSSARLMRSDMEQLRVEEGMKVIVSRSNGPKKEKPTKKGKKGRKKVARVKAASLDSF